jgi:cold shock CspA family protein
LILKLNNEEAIFVFSLKVSEERWNWLEEGKEYNFTVEEGKNGNKLLVDFEIEVEDV